MSKDNGPVVSEPTFIVIKYGDDQEAILNPWCSTYTFVEWIKRICQTERNCIVDLVDLEGQVRNLPVMSEEYASDYVTGRETYVVIRVEKQGENGPNRYISLLNNLEQVNPELLIKLNNLSRPGTRNSKKDKLRKAVMRTPRTTNSRDKQRPTSSSRNRQGK